MKIKSAISVILIIFFAFESLQGYSLEGYKWPIATFEYYIYPNNKDVNNEAAIAAIRKGANVWKPWCRAVYKGPAAEKIVRMDGKNTVFFRSREYGAIASAYVFHEGDQVLDFDIIFWDGAWKFYGGSNGCFHGYYIADVAAHEFGHAIGLGHSRQKEATMFWRASVCNNSERTLEIDDKNGATATYGIPKL